MLKQLDTRYTKTYATAANLQAALTKLGLDKVVALQVEVAGRYTAIFSAEALKIAGLPIAAAAHCGFYTTN